MEVKNPLRIPITLGTKGVSALVEPMDGRSNFDPEDLIKFFEFLEMVEPNVELIK